MKTRTAVIYSPKLYNWLVEHENDEHAFGLEDDFHHAMDVGELETVQFVPHIGARRLGRITFDHDRRRVTFHDREEIRCHHGYRDHSYSIQG